MIPIKICLTFIGFLTDPGNGFEQNSTKDIESWRGVHEINPSLWTITYILEIGLILLIVTTVEQLNIVNYNDFITRLYIIYSIVLTLELDLILYIALTVM